MAKRHSMNLIRIWFVAACTCAAFLPYHAAHWLVHHDAVYYRLGSAGSFGRFITNTAEMINILSPFPFVIFGVVVGIILVFTLRCFRGVATVESRVFTLATFVLSALTATAAESRLADAAQKSDRATIRALLKQHPNVNTLGLDDLVYAHYGLTSEEINMAEKAAKK